MNETVRRGLLATGGIAVVVLSVHLCGQLAQATDWVTVGAQVSESVRPRPGVWRLLRGTLHFLEIPALFVLATTIAYAVWRRDRRAAATFVVVFALTNFVVQGVKYELVWTPPELNPLSGHAGLAAGLGCAWLVSGLGGLGGRSGAGGGRAWRRIQVWGAGVVMAGTCGAVILTGWHTLPQVLAPIGIGVGCAVVGRALVSTGVPRPTSLGGAFGLVVLGAVMAFAARWGLDAITSSSAISDPVRTIRGLAVLLVTVVAATCAAIGLLGLASGFLRREDGAVTSAN